MFTQRLQQFHDLAFKVCAETDTELLQAIHRVVSDCVLNNVSFAEFKKRFSQTINTHQKTGLLP